MTILRKKTLLLLGAALAILAASLLFCGSAQAETYTINTNNPPNEYDSLDDLFSAVTLQDGDVIVLEKDDDSIVNCQTFTTSVTIKSNGGPWEILGLPDATDPVFEMNGAGLALTLENVDITGSDNTVGGSAVDFNNGPHTLFINGTVNLTGGSGSSSANGGPAVYVYADTQLTITGDGTGFFTGGTGSTDGNGLTAKDSLTVSGNGNFTFKGEAGLDVGDDVLISGGSVTATGIQVGAIIGGNLQIDTGAS